MPHGQAQANAGGGRASESRVRENRTHGSMRGSRGTALGEMVWLIEALDSERARNGLAEAPSWLGVQRSCSLLFTMGLHCSEPSLTPGSAPGKSLDCNWRWDQRSWLPGVMPARKWNRPTLVP
jgi:hypothetical protein